MGLTSDPLTPDHLHSILNSVRDLAYPDSCDAAPFKNVDLILQRLLQGEIELQGLLPWSSNYTFLVTVTRPGDETTLPAVYKPCAGERPLWDFPDGTLCHREFASYLISRMLGWPNIPPTILADGPHGSGSVQLFIEADYEAHYFNMRNISKFAEAFRQIALFDYIVNNADRKGGHCLKDRKRRLWAIDHGLTFHTDFKLRTVIWEFCDEAIPEPLLKALSHLRQAIDNQSEFCQILGHFLSRREIQALRQRIETLLGTGRFPDLHPGRNMPYPPI